MPGMNAVLLFCLWLRVPAAPVRVSGREPGPPPAAGGPASIGAAAPPPAVGPALLGRAVALLGRLEGRPAHRHAGDGRRLASPRLPPLLALEVAGSERPAAHRPRSPPTHPPDELGELAVGRAANSAPSCACWATTWPNPPWPGTWAVAPGRPSPPWRSFLANHIELPGVGRFLRRAHGHV